MVCQEKNKNALEKGLVKGEINVDAKRMVKVLGGKNIRLESVKGGSLTLDKKGNITVTGVEAHMN